MLKKLNAISLSAEEYEGDVVGGGVEGDATKRIPTFKRAAAAATQHATAIVVYTRRESFVAAAGHARAHT